MKNYIFDFGKVLVDFDPAYLTGLYVSDPADAALLSEVVFDRIYWDRLDSGTIEDDERKQEVFARLPERLHGAAECIYDHWVENLPPIEGMLPLLRDIKARGGKLYLLSNISHKFAREYAEVPALQMTLSLFDGLVFSAQVDLVKPSREIFRYVLDKYELDPQESIFIDDNAANIAGAAGAGLHTYHFDGDAARLREYLKY